MKKIVAIIVITCVTAMSCSPSGRTKTSTGLPLLIRVECRDDEKTQQTVLQLLRTGVPREVIITPNAGFVDIQATFVNVTTADYDTYERIKRQIRDTRGVLYVSINNATPPVKQAF